MKYRIPVQKIADQAGLTLPELAAVLNPRSNRQSRRVLIARWKKGDIDYIRFDQIAVLCDLMAIDLPKFLETYEEEAEG